MTGEALDKTLLPLGELTKPEVRELASRMGLITADKKDSQGICFVGQVGIEEFLREYVEVSPGEIIEQETGRVLGQHKGAIFYTIGQRHGLEIGGGLPYFVVGKDMAKNQVFVSRNLNQGGLWTREIKLGDCFWTHQAPVLGQKYQVRLRHLAPLVDAEITISENDTATIQFATDQKNIASGQSVVVYDGELCLGGGIAR